MWIGHRNEIRELTFRALALRRIRSDEGLTLETSAPKSVYGGQIHIINPVDKTKLSADSCPAEILWTSIFQGTTIKTDSSET